MNEENKDDLYINNEAGDNEFDFVGSYSEADESVDAEALPNNTADCAINCAFLGIGGGGGKMAKAFLDLGFNKTLLINTTVKDQPHGVPTENFLLIRFFH